MPDIPNNYESTDCTGVQTGNSDLGVPEWVPTKDEPGTTPLPIYPQPSDMPQPFIVREPRKGGEL